MKSALIPIIILAVGFLIGGRPILKKLGWINPDPVELTNEVRSHIDSQMRADVSGDKSETVAALVKQIADLEARLTKIANNEDKSVEIKKMLGDFEAKRAEGVKIRKEGGEKARKESRRKYYLLMKHELLSACAPGGNSPSKPGPKK